MPRVFAYYVKKIPKNLKPCLILKKNGTRIEFYEFHRTLPSGRKRITYGMRTYQNNEWITDRITGRRSVAFEWITDLLEQGFEVVEATPEYEEWIKTWSGKA